jgi:hypothetical protein
MLIRPFRLFRHVDPPFPPFPPCSSTFSAILIRLFCKGKGGSGKRDDDDGKS